MVAFESGPRRQGRERSAQKTPPCYGPFVVVVTVTVTVTVFGGDVT